MASTIERRQCLSCNIAKTSTWKFEGKTLSRCMNPGCDEHKIKVISEDTSNELIPEDINNNEEVLMSGEFKALPDRNISRETCKLYNFLTTDVNGVYVSHYFDLHHTRVLQCTRLPDKTFPFKNAGIPLELGGLHLFSPEKHKVIVITEGIEDAMSVYESTGIAACTIPCGATNAERDIKNNLPKLEEFEKIILWLDNDKPGKEALEKCRKIVPLGKSFEVILDPSRGKDANDILKNDPDGDEIHNLLLTAKEIVPKGVVFGSQLDRKKRTEKKPPGYTWPWPGLTEMTKGIRKGKFILIGGGSNIGKTPILKEIGFHLWNTYKDLKIANIYLEETEEDAPNAYLALMNNIPYDDFNDDPLKYISQEQYNKQSDMIETDRLMFTDTQYSLDSKEFIRMVEYLAKVKKYDIIILDHLSLVADETADNEGERKILDKLAKNCAKLCKEYNINIIAACHLSNPPAGQMDWEDGREVRQKDFHGSSGLRKYPHIMIGVERNARNENSRTQSTLRVIKNRGRGKHLGIADIPIYNEDTGRLIDISEVFNK